MFFVKEPGVAREPQVPDHFSRLSSVPRETPDANGEYLIPQLHSIKAE